MPQIKKPERKKRTKNSKRSNQSTKYYSDHRWKELRAWYRKEHPLCEECLKNGIITEAEHVHHKKEILSGETEEERWNLLLDPLNLESVCQNCHMEIHNYRHSQNKDKSNTKQSVYRMPK